MNKFLKLSDSVIIALKYNEQFKLWFDGLSDVDERFMRFAIQSEVETYLENYFEPVVKDACEHEDWEGKWLTEDLEGYECKECHKQVLFLSSNCYKVE